MKRKSLVLGLLALAALAVNVTEASAFFCHRPWRFRCHRYTTHITCRPYNAFTPICWGNLVCDGVCPSPCGVAGGCLPFQYMGGYPGFAGAMGCCPPTCMAPFCYAGNCGMMGGGYTPNVIDVAPAVPASPSPAPNNFTPPPPAPATSYYYPGAMNPYAYGMNPYANPYGVMRVGYHPGYYPGYYPTYNAGYNPAMYAAYYQTMYNWYNRR